MFSWTKISPIINLSYIPLHGRNITGINFCQCSKGRHILCNQQYGTKIHGIKILPLQAGGKIGKNFLLANISHHMVLTHNHASKSNTVIVNTSFDWDLTKCINYRRYGNFHATKCFVRQFLC